MPYHKPVLVDEVINTLNIKPNGIYLDVTFGGGGHSRAILESNPKVTVVGLDWDLHAIEQGELLVNEFPERLSLVWGSFAHLYKLLKKHKIGPFDGILADFGTSQFQIHERDGFSIYNETALDMRMSTAHFQITAEDVINEATERELCEIFWEYGEERNARQIVRKILEEREKRRIKTTQELAHLVENVVGKGGKIHPATRIFQALRIFVNKELDNIDAFLPVAFGALKSGGRLACISFHSLEDRKVKHFFKEEEERKAGEIITKKALTAELDELKENPSSRSAKLRVIQKK